jgi:hypothetical protein
MEQDQQKVVDDGEAFLTRRLGIETFDAGDCAIQAGVFEDVEEGVPHVDV